MKFDVRDIQNNDIIFLMTIVHDPSLCYTLEKPNPIVYLTDRVPCLTIFINASTSCVLIAFRQEEIT